MEKHQALPLNIQLFAEEEDKPEGTGAADAREPKDIGLPKTQEELDALINERLKQEIEKQAGQAQQTTPPPTGGNNAAQAAATTSPETALQRELVEARAQVAAVKEGVQPSAIEDAVCLAVHAAEKEGEVTQEAVAKALQEVVKRHPEWKQEEKKNSAGGFRVGAGGGKSENRVDDDQLAAIFGVKQK